MELVYLWIEDYKNIKEQGFNFSPKFECKYDKDSNELTIDEKENYISIFPENINVTAIVGENGSGKSSILDSITLIKEKKIDGFIIYNIVTSEPKKDEFSHYGNINPNKGKTNFINSDININTISTYNQNNNDIFEKHYELSKEIDLNKLLEDQYYFDSFKITMDIIQVKPEIYWREYASPENKALYNELDNMPTTIVNPNDFHYVLIHNFYISIIRFYLVNWSKLDKNKEFYEILRDFIISMNTLLLNRVLTNKDFLIQIGNLIHDINSLKYENDLIDTLLKYTNDILFSGLKEIIDKDKIRLECNESKKSLFRYKFSKIYKFSENPNISNYLFRFDSFCGLNDSFEMFDFITIDIVNSKTEHGYSDLSSGEQDLLNICINLLLDMKNNIIHNSEYIFTIDEPDAFLHPRWSKNLINKIITLYLTYAKHINEEIKIHLLFATHSPFILSDLAKENIIFLKNGKQDYPFKDNEQTFGANIHTLLSHGFFMEDGLMGEYAKEKINEVIEILKHDSLSSDEIKTCKDIISIIGEPILQKTLQSQLDMKLYPKETQLEKLEREQREIQAEIDELKKKNETD